MNRFVRLSAGLLIALAGSAAQAADAGVKLTQKEGVIDVAIGGKPFTEYRFAEEKGLPWARPYFYPVLAADGVEVTSDQSRSNPKEHPHHRSLWVAQGAVNGLDHWAHGKPGTTPMQQKHVKFDKVEGDTIVEKLEWLDADSKPMLNETRTWKFIPFADGSRGVDLVSVYSAVSGTVTFGDTKEAGLCAVRVAKPISDTSVITQSTGAVSNNAKEEKNVWGKKADWCDLSGKIDGKPYGVAILDHPANPKHPSNWHVRNYGLLAANIFGLHDYDKANPVGAGDFKIEPGKDVTFRYRVIVHTGDAASAKLDEKMKEYAGAKE